jgi:hypothetical protein
MRGHPRLRLLCHLDQDEINPVGGTSRSIRGSSGIVENISFEEKIWLSLPPLKLIDGMIGQRSRRFYLTVMTFQIDSKS